MTTPHHEIPYGILVVYFILAAMELFFLRRRLEAKVRAGELTRVVAEQKISRQWRLWAGLLIFMAVGLVSFKLFWSHV
jgi:hypothetical protein